MKSPHCLILFLLIFCTATSSNAQLCQGSLGDPVVNITFGAGTNPGPAIPIFIPYIFISGDCPSDGIYAVRNSTIDCFGDTWHSLTQDHTGDPNGYFMLVNASYVPGDFYLDTVHGLCSNTTFELAAWIVNVLKPSSCNGSGIRPNLTFSVETKEGSVLQTFNTGEIPADNTPQWKQYGFFFKTPPATSDVVMRIRNNAPGGCGNDLALDDITFRPCGPETSIAIANEANTTTKSVCDYNTASYLLSANASQGYTDPAYQWQSSTDNITWTDIPGATTLTYDRKPTGIGTYYYRVMVAEKENINTVNCRIASNIITFKVKGKPIPVTGSNSPACEGSVLTLSSTGGSSYAWTGPANFTASISQPSITNLTKAAEGKYYVTVTSAAGCVQQDSTIVTVVPKPIVQAGDNKGICEGSSTTLSASGSINNYAWSPPEGLSATNISNPVASPKDSTVYTVTVKDDLSGCIATDSVEIFVYRNAAANAGADKTTVEGIPVTLDGIASTTAQFNWSPTVFITGANTLNPSVMPPRDTTYTLHVTSSFGCGSASDNVFVRVFQKVDVPNAFSPNGDGINDTWKIPALNAYPYFTLSVFNRYGQAVFSSKGSYVPWNGKYQNADLPVGTYYYVIDVKESRPIIKGWIAILR